MLLPPRLLSLCRADESHSAGELDGLHVIIVGASSMAPAKAHKLCWQNNSEQDLLCLK